MSSLIRGIVWNGMLAVIPVALAYSMEWLARRRQLGLPRKALVALLGLAWLAFLPNTCYLLTEWRHFLEPLDRHDLYLRSQTDRMLLVELSAWWVFYFLYSAFGMLTFALAIRPVERLASSRGGSTAIWALPFFTVLSLGVYLGLVLRFNSWELLTRPGPIWQAITEVGSRPLLATFILAFGVFLWIAYRAIDIWVDGLCERWSRLTGRRIHVGPQDRQPG